MDSAVKQHGLQEWHKDSDGWDSSDVNEQNPLHKNGGDHCSLSWQHQNKQLGYDSTLMQWRQPATPLISQHHHQLHLQRTLFGCWQHLQSCQHLQQYQHAPQNHHITGQHAPYDKDQQLEEENIHHLENKDWHDAECQDRQDLPCHPHPLYASCTPSRRPKYKRKCSSMWGATDRQPDSDDECMPSVKRQRINVAAVQRLLATLSIAGTSSTGHRKQQHVQQPNSIPSTRPTTDNYFKTETATHVSHLDNKIWPKQDNITVDNSLLQSSVNEVNINSCRHKPTTNVGTAVRNYTTVTDSSHDGKAGDITSKTSPSCNFQKSVEVNATQADTASENTDVKTNAELNNNSSLETLLEHKSQSTAEHEHSSDNTHTAGTSSSDDDHNYNISSKRNADEDGAGEKQCEGQHMNKRVRKLKRGLRLCTNITCYIEQVLYNC